MASHSAQQVASKDEQPRKPSAARTSTQIPPRPFHDSNSAQLFLRPATRETVVTKTITTTVHFKPISIPRVPKIQLLEERERTRYAPYQIQAPASSPTSGSAPKVLKLDPKVYPLAAASLPDLFGDSRLTLGSIQASFASERQDATTSKVQIDDTPPSPLSQPVNCRTQPSDVPAENGSDRNYQRTKRRSGRAGSADDTTERPRKRQKADDSGYQSLLSRPRRPIASGIQSTGPIPSPSLSPVGSDVEESEQFLQNAFEGPASPTSIVSGELSYDVSSEKDLSLDLGDGLDLSVPCLLLMSCLSRRKMIS